MKKTLKTTIIVGRWSSINSIGIDRDGLVKNPSFLLNLIKVMYTSYVEFYRIKVIKEME